MTNDTPDVPTPEDVGAERGSRDADSTLPSPTDFLTDEEAGAAGDANLPRPTDIEAAVSDVARSLPSPMDSQISDSALSNSAGTELPTPMDFAADLAESEGGGDLAMPTPEASSATGDDTASAAQSVAPTPMDFTAEVLAEADDAADSMPTPQDGV